MKILVACEESQRVCTELRKLGHEAYSCDIQEPSGGHPEWHILGDVLEILNPIESLCLGKVRKAVAFATMDGKSHIIWGKWNMIIAHPPCTYLSNAGSVRLVVKGVLNEERYQRGLQAKEFFMEIANADCDRICIENPVPNKRFNLPKYTQIIEPYYFGDPYKKKTCLWVKNLPKLQPTNIVEPLCSWVSGGSKDGKGNVRKQLGIHHSAKDRAKTFPGIAKAMAEQWAGKA